MKATKFNINIKYNIYPITFENIVYYEKDCTDLFNAYYTSRNQLIDGIGIYINNNEYVSPNGIITIN
jgi:hypothetical protein